MPPALPPVATGGLAAALVSSFLRDPVTPPLFCQDLVPPDRICWSTFLAGILVGILLAQVLDFVVLLRHWVRLQLQSPAAGFRNYLAIKSRLG